MKDKILPACISLEGVNKAVMENILCRVNMAENISVKMLCQQKHQANHAY